MGVAVGEGHSVALTASGTLWAWGYNAEYELGDGNTTGSTIPVRVLNLSNVSDVAVGQESTNVAVKSDGSVWTWGSNFYGQLGDGGPVYAYAPTPEQVPGLTGVTAVAAGDGFDVALKADGSVWTWGNNTSTGFPK